MADETQSGEPTPEQQAAAAQADADAAATKKGKAKAVAPSFVKPDEFDGQPMFVVGGALVDPHGRPIGADGTPVGATPQTDL